MDSLFGDVAFLFVLAFVVVFVNGFGVYSSDFYMLDEQTQNSLKLAESKVDAFGYPLSTVSVLLSIILVFLIRIAWSHQTN